jgi:hypothetical protein
MHDEELVDVRLSTITRRQGIASNADTHHYDILRCKSKALIRVVNEREFRGKDVEAACAANFNLSLAVVLVEVV